MNKITRFGIVVSILIFAILLVVNQASAQTIIVEIEGNGDGSKNSADINIDNSTDVVSENEAEVSNEVEVSQNTGENETSDNTGGEVEITTGDSETKIEIDNNVNESIILDSACCPGEADIEVSGNGSDSQNIVSLSQDNSSQVIATNLAKITNEAKVSANSGKNIVKNNTGNVVLETGNIKGQGEIKNSGNKTFITSGDCCDPKISVLNSNNGANSKNVVSLEINNSFSVVKSDELIIFNTVELDFNTGANFIGGNVGDVVLATGDIDFDFEIINDPVNFDFVAIGGWIFDPAIDDPGEETPTGGIPEEEVIDDPGIFIASSDAGDGGDDDNGGEGGGLSLAQLPATGANLLLLFFLWFFVLLAGVTIRVLPNKNLSYLQLRFFSSPRLF